MQTKFPSVLTDPVIAKIGSIHERFNSFFRERHDFDIRLNDDLKVAFAYTRNQSGIQGNEEKAYFVCEKGRLDGDLLMYDDRLDVNSFHVLSDGVPAINTKYEPTITVTYINIIMVAICKRSLKLPEAFYNGSDYIVGVSNNMVRAVNLEGQEIQAGRVSFDFFNNENEIIPGLHKINPEYFMLKMEYKLTNYVHNIFCCPT